MENMQEKGNIYKKLGEYISSTSYKDHKSYYHDLAMNACKKGIIHPSYKYSVFREIIKQEVEDKNESYLNDYLTLIHEIDQNEAIDLINFIASARTNNYYPQIFLDLLSSENEDFVEQIISWSSNCWYESKCKEVKYKLYEIFDNRSEKLKFKTAFVLMHDYEDLAAYNYLISIVESENQLLKTQSTQQYLGLGMHVTMVNRCLPD